MKSLRSHFAHARWKGAIYLRQRADGPAARIPGWVLRLLLGDARIVVLSSEAGELHAELWPFAVREKCPLRASFQDERWVPERAWRDIRQAEQTCPVILVFPPALTLIHEIRVPLTALENLEGTIRHSLSSLTPFVPGEVHVSARPCSLVGEQAAIELRFARTDQVNALLRAFAEAGVRADRVSLDGRMTGAVILDSLKSRRVRRRHLVDGMLFALLFTLVIGAGISAWGRQERAMLDLQAAIRSEAETLRQQQMLQEKIARSSLLQETVRNQRRAGADVALLVEEITAALPPGSTIRDLTWEASRGNISILSQNPLDLRGLLGIVNGVTNIHVQDQSRLAGGHQVRAEFSHTTLGSP